MPDGARDDLVVGVVGTGTMGRGIAQVAAAGGMRVLLLDERAGAASEAADFIAKMLRRAAEKGRTTPADAEAAITRLTVCERIDDLADCDLAVEAVFEDLEVKRDVFRRLEAVVRDDCVIASNTSSLSITEIAGACRRPERIAGFHFFNPVPLMMLVEVIAGMRTAAWVSDALEAIGRRMGREPVRASDSPGFLVNHAGRGYAPEALRILSERIAEPADVDAIMKEGAGFRMGPFELLDLVGLDVAHAVMEQIYRQYYEEAAYRPSVVGRQRTAAGLLGRKSGTGFYRYEDGKKAASPVESAAGPAAGRIWVSRVDPHGHEAVTGLLAKLGADLDDGEHPAPDSTCVVTPLGEDASTAAVAQGLDPARTLAVDALFGLESRRTVMRTPLTDPDRCAALATLLASDGGAASAIDDSPGFVAQRIVALIVNVGCNIAQQGIALPADIDTAVKLGLAYPRGPLEWGDALGPRTVLRILDGLESFYRDGRYRPAPWLRRRATLGVSLLTPGP